MEERSSHFFARKLHSLSGIIPVGFFLIEHIISNTFALQGADKYNSWVAFLTSVPGKLAIEAIIIGGLLFHGIYGLFIMLDAKNNVNRYGYVRNWFFYLQRATGIIAFIFIAVHLASLRFAYALGILPEVNFATMASTLSNPAVMVFYILGVVSAAFHFANGLWLFGITWGITVGPKAQAYSAYLAGLVFVAMSGAGLASLLAFVR